METYNIVGETFTNKKGYQYTVLCKENKTPNGIQLYAVKFHNTGYIAHNISSGHIRAGEVKDYYAPSVFGVGCLGTAVGYAKRKESRRLYYTWRNMIRRCYDPTFHKYKFYGGKGVYVCDRWHRLDHFIEDVTHLSGYDPVKFESGEIELDKDILGTNHNIYSPETCCFVTHHENVLEANKRRWHAA